MTGKSFAAFHACAHWIRSRNRAGNYPTFPTHMFYGRCGICRVSGDVMRRWV